MWLLTKEYNDYDQYGEYYVYAWNHRPNLQEVDLALDTLTDGYHDIKHILNGGGRQKDEDIWFNLFEQTELKQ